MEDESIEMEFIEISISLIIVSDGVIVKYKMAHTRQCIKINTGGGTAPSPVKSTSKLLLFSSRK